MHLHVFLLANAFLDENLLHFLAVVALQLDDFAALLVFDNVAIASKFLLEDFEHFLLVK